MPLIPTPLGPLSVTLHGDGPFPLLLWPSVFTDSAIFAPLIPRLAGAARLVLIDGPGHGASPGTGQRFTMEDCGAAMLAVMDALSLPRAVAGGVSWGGIAAAHAALAAPDRIDGVVMMNTPMHLDGQRPGLRARAIVAGAGLAPGAAPFRNGVARSFFTPARLAAEPEYAARFHAMLRGADRRALGAAVASVFLNGRPLAEDLPHLRPPALILAGAEDPLYPAETLRAAAARAPRARFARVPGRHIAPIEAPDETARALRGFLAGLAGSGGKGWPLASERSSLALT